MRYDLPEMQRLLESGAVDEADYWAMLRSSQREFGRLIFRSAALVNLLSIWGVVLKNNRGHVRTAESFARYWQEYLPPWGRAELMAAALEVPAIPFQKSNAGLRSALELTAALDSLRASEMRLELLKQAGCEMTVAMETTLRKIRQELRRLEKERDARRRQLRQEITAAGLSSAAATILEMRYVDCWRFSEIERETGWTARKIYRLHRGGVIKMFSEKIF